MSIEPIINYFKTLQYHDREILLRVMEVAERALILDCHEKELYQGLKMSLWTSVKIEEIGE